MPLSLNKQGGVATGEAVADAGQSVMKMPRGKVMIDKKVEDITATLSGSGKESVEFTTDSFSLFAFTYTVDFTYDGYTWSFPGKGSYALSEVLSALGIYIGHLFGTRFKAGAERVGGIILILMGLKILLEHLGILNV